MLDTSLLLPGDVILYRPSSIIGWIIAIKTWSFVSHVECYIGNNKSIGARPEGVNIYPLRNDKYVSYILRPTEPFDIVKAMEWFNKEAKGDKYDIGGLFGFFLTHNTKLHFDKEFCSMLAAMWYDAGDCFLFNSTYPENKIAPAQFLQTPHLSIIWKAE